MKSDLLNHFTGGRLTLPSRSLNDGANWADLQRCAFPIRLAALSHTCSLSHHTRQEHPGNGTEWNQQVKHTTLTCQKIKNKNIYQPEKQGIEFAPAVLLID